MASTPSYPRKSASISQNGVRNAPAPSAHFNVSGGSNTAATTPLRQRIVDSKAMNAMQSGNDQSAGGVPRPNARRTISPVLNQVKNVPTSRS